MTKVNAGGARHKSHAARRASLASPVSWRTRQARAAAAPSADRFATTSSPAPTEMPGTSANASGEYRDEGEEPE